MKNLLLNIQEQVIDQYGGQNKMSRNMKNLLLNIQEQVIDQYGGQNKRNV